MKAHWASVVCCLRGTRLAIRGAFEPPSMSSIRGPFEEWTSDSCGDYIAPPRPRNVDRGFIWDPLGVECLWEQLQRTCARNTDCMCKDLSGAILYQVVMLRTKMGIHSGFGTVVVCPVCRKETFLYNVQFVYARYKPHTRWGPQNRPSRIQQGSMTRAFPSTQPTWTDLRRR